MKNLIHYDFQNVVKILLIFLFISTGLNAWDLKKDEDGIQVYTRPFPGSSIVEFKGTTVISAPFENVLKKITDITTYPTWLQYCKEARLLKKISPTSSLTYSVNKLPFPLNDRDSVTLSVREIGKDSAVIRFEAAPDEHPITLGLVRIQELKGSWMLKSIEDGKTEIVYQVHSNPGGSVPSWTINSRIAEQPFKTLKNLKELLEK